MSPGMMLAKLSTLTQFMRLVLEVRKTISYYLRAFIYEMGSLGHFSTLDRNARHSTNWSSPQHAEATFQFASPSMHHHGPPTIDQQDLIPFNSFENPVPLDIARTFLIIACVRECISNFLFFCSYGTFDSSH